ncbi:MAG: formate dehydrogenase subunit gamma [Hyphomicrobium sp.]|nr:formate dehydrogenase subunit gamma [Hyphomicrobium sp.]
MAKTSKASPQPAEAKPANTPADIKTLAICASYGNQPSELLEILHDVQHALGHVPESTLPVIANALNLSRAEVHGVVTFYHDFKRAPGGQHTIKVCRAEACQSMGTDHLCRHAEKTLKTKMGGTSADGKVSLEQVFCLGNCSLSPAVLVGDKLYGKVDTKRFDEIVATLGKETAQ